MRAAILLTVSFATLSARDLVPDHWIENVPSTNESIQTSLVFRTVPGVAYRVETSVDSLSDWTTDSEFYGLGHEIVAPMREFTPPPPPEPGEPPAGPTTPARSVSLVLQPSSAPEGGTVASWKSLDHGGPMTALLEENLHEDWSSLPLYWQRFGDHWFFVFHSNGEAQPPSEAPSLGTLDSAMLEQLETSLPAMNQEVATSAALARNAPPPAPPVPGSKKFWRIHADWNVDTDADGSFDWEEFEIAADLSHPSHDLGQAFNADADGNGVADGDQADTDQDGIANSEDADRGKNVIDWQRAGDVRFAWFEVSPPMSPWGGEQFPIQVTDRGHVVFPWGLWSSGSYSNIARSGDRTDNCAIIGMNCALGDVILGTGNYDNNDDGYAELGCMVWWQNGSPRPVRSGEYFASFPFSIYPSNGQFLGNDLGFVGSVYSQGTIDPEMARWKLPWQGGSSDASFDPVDQWVMYGSSSGLLWGGNQAKIGGVTSTLPGTYDRLVVTPGNSVVAFSESARPALYRNGSWTVEETFGNLVDFSNRGFGVSASPVTVWNNGKTKDLTAAAPELPQEWQQKSRFVDLSDAGNLLVSRQNSPSESPNAFGLGVPITLEDDEEATGVDVTSITSTEPGPGINNKLWIMAPSSGTNLVKFKSTASAGSCQLGMVASPATFDPSFLASNNETVAVGAGLGSDSADLDLRFSNGSAQSLSWPVGIKVMKNRTVGVKVWVVPLKIGTTSFRDPAYIPQDEELSLYLTKVFGRQINATIECSVTRVDPVDFESENGADFGGPENSTWEGGYRKLDFHGNYEGEAANVSANVDANRVINVYLVGGVDAAREVYWEGGAINKFLADAELLGKTDRAGRRCWVVGGATDGSAPGITKEVIQETMAHEIGHVIVGLGHPDEEGGDSPLPGTDRVRRLMCSGTLRKTDGSCHQLVKGEWDNAEKWLGEFVDPEP